MQNENKISKIYLASDHAGFELKEKVKLYLENIKKENNFEIVDFGANKYDDVDDYTVYMHRTGHDLSVDAGAGGGDADNFFSAAKSVAIVFGGSGEGEAMVMNRYDGVRCTTYYGHDLNIVKLGREHNNANALSLGARFVDYDECISAVKLFLNTVFERGRHMSRVEKIDHKLGFLSRFF
jgi:ribose 5-phosphate isomerase B